MPANASPSWPLPMKPRPIVIIGAGGIVNDAHLPAYTKAGLPVAGVYDVDRPRAVATARKFALPCVFDSLVEAVQRDGVVFDIAVPPEHATPILEALPRRAIVLMQKPMGRDLAEARHIRALCNEREMIAAVNFQMRFSPMMLALRNAIDRGELGEIVEFDLRLNVRTPWELWPFLTKLNRVEILVHSIHYLDAARSLLGEPCGVYARTLPDPRFPGLRSTRSSMILDFGDRVRCCLSINHNHLAGPARQVATLCVEGTRGAATAKLGLLLNYPHGEPETLEISTGGGPWRNLPLVGSWFPDAFIGTMSNLQRFAAGEDKVLHTSVEDAFKTMALVEACYESDRRGATPIPQ